MNKTGEIKKGMCEKNNLDESQKQAGTFSLKSWDILKRSFDGCEGFIANYFILREQ